MAISLHKPEEIFSRRHVPSWILFAFSAGNVNALSILAFDNYVTHVTGTVTRFGLSLSHLDVLIDLIVIVVCFVLGAMFSAYLINGRVHQRKRPHYMLPLMIVGASMVFVALAGHCDLLGEFGGTVDELGDFVMLSVLSFAMGLQNASVATSTGLLVRTTHLTGPATDLGVHLVELFYTTGDAQLLAKRHAALRAGKIVAFAVGAIVAVPLARRAQFLGFLLPAFTTFIATAASFRAKHVEQPVVTEAELERAARETALHRDTARPEAADHGP